MIGNSLLFILIFAACGAAFGERYRKSMDQGLENTPLRWSETFTIPSNQCSAYVPRTCGTRGVPKRVQATVLDQLGYADVQISEDLETVTIQRKASLNVCLGQAKVELQVYCDTFAKATNILSPVLEQGHNDILPAANF